MKIINTTTTIRHSNCYVSCRVYHYFEYINRLNETVDGITDREKANWKNQLKIIQNQTFKLIDSYLRAYSYHIIYTQYELYRVNWVNITAKSKHTLWIMHIAYTHTYTHIDRYIHKQKHHEKHLTYIFQFQYYYILYEHEQSWLVTWFTFLLN